MAIANKFYRLALLSADAIDWSEIGKQRVVMLGRNAGRLSFRWVVLPAGLLALVLLPRPQFAAAQTVTPSAPQFPLDQDTGSQPYSSSSGSSSSSSSGSSNSSSSGSGNGTQSGASAAPLRPAALSPVGPAVSMQTSESVFDVMAGLNTCGYNEGLSVSDPVRKAVRNDMDEALQKSEPARDARDKLCAFIRTHTMSSHTLNLAAYISLALFLSPPPALTTNISTSELPPDAGPLIGMAPLLRKFSEEVNLHLIWVLHRSEYDAEVVKAHKAMQAMLIQTDIYLKQPPPSYGPRRFVVILEPLIAPSEVNARVYGGDYIVVESPVNGKINLKPVKHTYLRFILEPLIYARSKSIDKLTPILELVQSAPIPFEFKSDILSLVTECMIRAIEAHTMDTGVTPYKIPAHFNRSQAAAINSAENRYEDQVSEVRRQAVRADMTQGYILTRYFYEHLDGYDQSPTTLEAMVGEMVYGMNADAEKHRVSNLIFAAPTNRDAVHPVSGSPDLLDQGEKKLIAGDAAAAAGLARKALADHTVDPGRAEFLLARAEIMQNNMDSAEQAFQRAAKVSHNLRTVAWSHIFLGRLADLQGHREAAIAEYQLAMKTRDGRPDTRQAAEAGLKAPFSPPGATQSNPSP